MVFFGEIYGFLQLIWIYLFGANRGYFLLETPRLQEVFLSKTKSVFTGKQYTWCSCFYNKSCSFKRYICFFNLTDRPVWNKNAFYHFAISDLQEVSFQKLTQLSQGNNVLKVPAVNTDSLLRDMFGSSI
jgi:hypothetical protein